MAPPNEVSPADVPAAPRPKPRKKKQNGIHKKKTKPPTPKKSLIRKRPVSFGNPALGTYHGCLYTLDVVGEDYSPINRPIIEGAESVERVVAMVDVPPEQVPEGILNLARSHRPYLYHVRIVIAEHKEEYQHNTSKDVEAIQGQEETKEEMPAFATSAAGSGPGLGMPLQSTSLTAASIMADEELQASSSADSNSSNNNPQVTNVLANTSREESKGDNQEGETFKSSARTYLVLLELCSVEAAECFVEDLHGKPYTSLDPTQTCSVHQVLAWTGEDGVSLLSPFFAPAAKSTSPKGSGSCKTKTKTSGANGSSSNNTTTRAVVPATSQATATPAPAQQQPPTTPPIVEDYNCAVCLEHMILSEAEQLHDNDNDASKMLSSILTTVCNHSFHMDCLLKWQDSPCPVCRYDHSGLNEALSQCHLCGRTENNYVCLICGVVSCGGAPIVPQAASTAAQAQRMQSQSPVCGGRAVASSSSCMSNNNTANNDALPPAMENSRILSQSHARTHYDETLHAYALDTQTQHVWDFAGQGYVHRLLQNKEDGKLVEFHDPSNTSSHERSLTPGLSENQEGEIVHRKLEGFASQYYTLLKSQLEQQRIYYQGRLEELRRESLVRKKAQTSDLIHALKQEKAQLSKRVVSLRGRHCKVVEDTAFLKNMNESLEANKEPLKRKVKEAQRQRIEARDHLQQSLPVLEEKIAVLLQELTGETHDVENEAANTESPQHGNSSQSEDRKPAAKR